MFPTKIHLMIIKYSKINFLFCKKVISNKYSFISKALLSILDILGCSSSVESNAIDINIVANSECDVNN